MIRASSASILRATIDDRAQRRQLPAAGSLIAPSLLAFLRRFGAALCVGARGRSGGVLWSLLHTAARVAEPSGIVLEIAVKGLRSSVVYDIESVADGTQEVPVVRDHDHRARVVLQRHCQRLTHFQVQMVCRFIEQEEVGSLECDKREYQSRFLAT